MERRGSGRTLGRGWDVSAEAQDMGCAADRGLAFGDPGRKASPSLGPEGEGLRNRQWLAVVRKYLYYLCPGFRRQSS